MCAARRRCQPALPPPSALRPPPAGSAAGRAGDGRGAGSGERGEGRGERSRPGQGIPPAQGIPPSPGHPSPRAPTRRPPGPAAPGSSLSSIPVLSSPGALQGSALPQPLIPLCSPKKTRHLPGGSGSSHGGSWTLRSVPCAGDFHRPPSVSDFGAGRERSGALPSPAQPPPGCPRGAPSLPPGHLRAGHGKGETNLIGLWEAAAENRKRGPGLSPSLGPRSQPWGPHICQLGLGNPLL